MIQFYDDQRISDTYMTAALDTEYSGMDATYLRRMLRRLYSRPALYSPVTRDHLTTPITFRRSLTVFRMMSLQARLTVFVQMLGLWANCSRIVNRSSSNGTVSLTICHPFYYE